MECLRKSCIALLTTEILILSFVSNYRYKRAAQNPDFCSNQITMAYSIRLNVLVHLSIKNIVYLRDQLTIRTLEPIDHPDHPDHSELPEPPDHTEGRIPLPNRMNFWKNSKLPLTPPPLIFGKLRCKFFWKTSENALYKSH